MNVVFVPMLVGNNGILAADTTVVQRSVILVLLAIYPLGQYAPLAVGL